MSQSIVVFGSYVADLMAIGNGLPTPGETITGTYFQMGAGGKGFNQAVAAHKAGGNVKLITRMGHDSFGQIALDTMESLAMTQEYILYGDEGSGVALITVDAVSG